MQAHSSLTSILKECTGTSLRSPNLSSSVSGSNGFGQLAQIDTVASGAVHQEFVLLQSTRTIYATLIAGVHCYFPQEAKSQLICSR